MDAPSILPISSHDLIVNIAILVLWSIICFTIGRMYGRSEQWEEESPNTEQEDQK